MAEKKWYDDAVMVNRDPNWMYRAGGDSPEVCRSVLESFFSKYEGNSTDILLGVLEQTTTMPSKHLMWRGLKAVQTIENGHEVSYPDHMGMYKAYTEYGVDGVQIFIDEVRRLGKRPWITLRVNDVHFPYDETSFLHSDMFYEEVKAGHNIGEHYGYYGNAFDFKKSVRYREALLGFIGEILDTYDVFGIEMDFMREIYCFDYLGDSEGIHDIILDFMREVKRMAKKAEERVGHDYKISIRTCRDPEDAYTFGFDIKKMADEGLIDIVVPSPRWSPTDSGIPIRKWKALLGDSVGIIGGIESHNFKQTYNTWENAKAYAAAFYAQGADGIYFNNHENFNDRNRLSWTVNRASCYEGRRYFVVTEQDCAAYKSKAYKPLPFKIISNYQLPLEIGKVKKGDKVTLIIDYEGEKLPKAAIGNVRAEGKVVEPLVLPLQNKEQWLNATEHTPVEYDLSGFETDGPIVLRFIGSGTVHYVRLTIDAN